MLPFLPVPLNKSRYVIRFGLSVLKIDVSGLGSASVRIPIGGDAPRFSARLQLWVGHDPDRHVDAFALAALEKAVMLQVDLETVGHLENLTHPRGTQIVETFFYLIVVVEDVVGRRPFVNLEHSLAGASHTTVGLLAAVSLLHRDAELEDLLFAFARLAPRFFDSNQLGRERVEMARRCLPAPQLPEEFEFVGFDVFAAIGIVAVYVYVDFFSR